MILILTAILISLKIKGETKEEILGATKNYEIRNVKNKFTRKYY